MNFPVTIDRDIMSGMPVFIGTRVPVSILFDHIDNGETIEDFLIGFPGVSREQVYDYLKCSPNSQTDPIRQRG
jgi:uncharacterized protein (DUF433 family)